MDDSSPACQNTNPTDDNGGGGSNGNGGGSGNGNGFDPVASYKQGWTNFGMAWSTLWNPNASLGGKVFAYGYMMWWGGAHVMGVAGVGILAWSAVTTLAGGCAVNSGCAENVGKTAGEVVDDVANAVQGQLGGTMERLANSPGWKITWEAANAKGQDVLVRIAEYSSTRAAPYFRVTSGSFGGFTAEGIANTVDKAATHINIDMANPSSSVNLIIQLVQKATSYGK